MNPGERGNFKLALAQMCVTWGDVRANLARATKMIALAAGKGARVVLLPEALDAGWTNPSSPAIAEGVPDGRACKTYRDAARELGVYVCAGLTERAGTAVYNAAVLISPQGEVLLHHRKLNELEIGHDIYAQGDRLGVAHTPLGTLGLMICADGSARGQVVTRTLGLMGADVVLSPCAWAVPPGHDNARENYGGLWRDCYGAAARDFRMWIAGCSSVGRLEGGPWDGHSCIGCSLVVDPDGRPVLTGPYGEKAEKLLLIDVKPAPRPARGSGWERLLPRREEASEAGDREGKA